MRVHTESIRASGTIARVSFLWSEVPHLRESELQHACYQNGRLEQTQDWLRRLPLCAPPCLPQCHDGAVLVVAQLHWHKILEDNLGPGRQRGYIPQSLEHRLFCEVVRDSEPREERGQIGPMT